VNEAKEYVSSILTNELSKKCLFHTINHTLDVLKNAEIIGKYCKLNEKDLQLLRMSALFHDLGYVDTYDEHEIYSARRARAYLELKAVDESTIKKVESAILSTRMPQNPQDTISEMLCDADLMNLTVDDYFEQVDLMRREWEKVGKAKMNSHEFHMNSLEFFKSHQYYSEYGRKILQPKKEKIERKIKNKVAVDH
jgi:predicted metal-dependent HD superfamily phosphohydrolase